MIHIEKRGTRIIINSSEPLSGLKTAVPGAYQAVGGHWTVPLSIESCHLLKTKYGSQIVAGNELKRWVRGVTDSRRYMADLAKSSDAKLEHLRREAPDLLRAMNGGKGKRPRKYQKVGVRFVADNPASLIADDPGLGKTLEALGGILEAQIPGPYLVCAPKTATASVWKPEIERWLPNKHKAVVLPDGWHERDRKLRLTNYDQHTWLIVHPEILLVPAYWVCARCKKRTPLGAKQQAILDCNHQRDNRTKTLIEPKYPLLYEKEWGALILDESHENLIIRKGARTQRRRGMDMLKVRKGGIKLALSGTPFEHKPHQLWGTLNWLDPKQYPAFYRWAELFWAMGGYGGYEVQELRDEREKLLWDSLSSICLRRTKDEVAKDLPPKMDMGELLDPSDENSPVGIWLPMEPEQERAYVEMEEHAVAELDSGRLEAIIALEELTRLKQMACSYGDIEQRWTNVKCDKIKLHHELYPKCSGYRVHKVLKNYYVPQAPSNKLNWVKEQLEEWGYPKHPIDKVVVVSQFSGILRLFAREIDKHFKSKPDKRLCTGITGKTPAHRRPQIIDAFNKRDTGPQIMMLNVKAGGTAITIDSASRMIFPSETRVPTQQLQAEDRIHRVSNPRNCMYYYLRSIGTVDVGTALVNQEAKRDTFRLLDERRGVEYFREVVHLGHSMDRKTGR